MEQKEKQLAAFVLRRGKELFGDSFLVETNENQMPKMVIRKILGEHEDVSVVEMEIMQYADGTEVFWSDSGGFLKEEIVRKLSEEGKCQMGIRNNRIGTREKYATPAGEWLRLNHFSTEDESCVEIFLEQLFELRESAREDVRYPNVKIDDFCGNVWKIVNHIFNPNVKDDLRVEYFPSFNSKDQNCCSTFTIWLREDFYVQVRIFPDYQEFVCQNPGRFWRRHERSKMSTDMWKKYDAKMIEYEKELQYKLRKIDEKSILIKSGDIEFPYTQVGAVCTSNPKVVELLCNILKEHEDPYFLRRALKEDEDYLEQKERYFHFY